MMKKESSGNATLFAGIRREWLISHSTGCHLLPNDIWTYDEGRAECRAYHVWQGPAQGNICEDIADKAKNIVVKVDIDRKYVLKDDPAYFVALDIERAVHDGKFHPVIFTEIETESLSSFEHEEDLRRFH